MVHSCMGQTKNGVFVYLTSVPMFRECESMCGLSEKKTESVNWLMYMHDVNARQA